MQWLERLDVDTFRFMNMKLVNPFFDQVMPLLSGNAIFFPVVILACLLLIWRGGVRGLVCVLMLAAIVSAGDGLVCRTIKHAVGRDRPFLGVPDARCLIGKGGSGSMPSSHAANWFAATMVMFIYYRRSLWFMLPGALLVSFSRIYNGVHYPSDVVAGAILGAGYAAGAAWSLNALWVWAGQKWFPLWWARFPSILAPKLQLEPDETEDAPVAYAPRRPPGSEQPVPPSRHVSIDEHWLRLGYIVTFVLLIARFFYLASGTIQLSEDEAYQWIWSKHLALSYYSKPPLIAYTQFLGTSLFGDNEFGVRFFSSVIAAILSVMMLRFFAREVNARAGFILLLIITATPLMSAGAVLMTIDPLSVLFWTATMISGWSAVQERGTTRDWILTGVWMGLGFLSKYTELLQLLCWVVFFALWQPARKHLRRPGPYLALLVNAILSLPVLIWNSQHGWITVTHVGENAGVGDVWKPTLRFMAEFVGAELGLLNPIFFVACVWASAAFWRRNRNNPRLVYFFSMGAPLFLCYFFFTLHSRVKPNWIAPSVIPLLCLTVTYWDTQWRLGLQTAKIWVAVGLVTGK
jgi:membrane-associated phospholipid phosphatase